MDIVVDDHDHKHAYMEWITFHRAPTGPYPAHTAFVVMLCPVCGAWSVFPKDNFDLCTPEFKALLEATAKQAGWFLAHDLKRPPGSADRST